MARGFNGSSEYLSASSTLLSDEPINIVAHGNSSDLTASQAAVSIGDGGANTGQYSLIWRGDVSGDPIRAQKNNDAGTGAVQADTSTGYSSSTWHVGYAQFVSDTFREVTIDGGSQGSDSTSRSDPTPDWISIGASRRSSLNFYFNGSVAEAYMLDINATVLNVAIGAGVSPFYHVPLGNIRAYYPLHNHDQNRVANGYPDLSPTGSPTFTDHPPKVMYPRINARIML